MPRLLQTQLNLSRCPHCRVDSPHLRFAAQHAPENFNKTIVYWRVYICNRCAGLIAATAAGYDDIVQKIYPSSHEISDDIPERPRAYLNQAINSLIAPAGAVMLAASSVDAMLKSKGLINGSLYSRIDEAAKAHLITADMAAWAHEVRLDANDQRHADDDAPLPTQEQAIKCTEFASALAQFLFVLPARVERGMQNAKAQS